MYICNILDKVLCLNPDYLNTQVAYELGQKYSSKKIHQKLDIN